MRSLTLKLTLAFVLVGLVGVVLLAVLVGSQTRREFDVFVGNRYRVELIERLAGYYQATGSWSGVDAYLPSQFGRGMRPMSIVLTDVDGTVIADNRPPGRPGEQPGDLVTLPVEVGGETVGYVSLPAAAVRAGPGPGPGMAAEDEFIRNTRTSTILSALAAALLALLLGVGLARTITRPVRELTAATRAVAGGDFGRQVSIQSTDELGELATAFNQMSNDLAMGQQTRRQMTADIAHDLRTPLTVILGYTEALSDGVLPGDPEMFGAMHQQAQHLSRLVDDLRTLSLADAGQLSLHRVPVVPSDLLEQAAAAYSRQAESRGIALTVGDLPDLPLIMADPDRVQQVLGNLVSNALRFTPAGGRVTLSADADDEQVRLRVSDTGPGIAPGDLPHIFDRFYRADKSRTADGASGLGLAIVRSLVEANGGRVTVESPTGAGASFVVSLPVVA